MGQKILDFKENTKSYVHLLAMQKNRCWNVWQSKTKSGFCITICKKNKLGPEEKNKLNLGQSILAKFCPLFDGIIKEFYFSSCFPG